MQVAIRELVPTLKLAVVLGELLHSVVSQVHERIFILQVERSTRRPDVPLLENEELVVVSHQHPHSDVELTPTQKQWTLDILLNHKLSTFVKVALLLLRAGLLLLAPLTVHSRLVPLNPPGLVDTTRCSTSLTNPPTTPNSKRHVHPPRGSSLPASTATNNCHRFSSRPTT